MFTFPLLFYQTGTKDTRHIYGQKKEGGLSTHCPFSMAGESEVKDYNYFFSWAFFAFPFTRVEATWDSFLKVTDSKEWTT